MLYQWVKTVEKEDTYILLNPNEPVSFKEEKEFLKKSIEDYKNKKKIIIGAFENHKYLGSCSIEQLERRQKHVGRLGIVLLKNYRSEGIGKQLAEHTINLAQKKLGLSQIILAVFANNKIGQRLYKKMGFKKYGRHPKAVLYKGQKIDEILLYKNL